MRKEQALVLDERDAEIARILMELGLSRGVARCLVFLAQVDEAVSLTIEQGASLRQPEVSTAMQQLRKRGWAVKRDLKKPGKGRPVHCYRLVRPLEDIVAHIEEEKRAEAERNARNLSRLTQLVGGLKPTPTTR